MKSTFKNLFAPLLAILALTTTAFGQLQWSSYDKTGTLVTANVASGGDSTYGRLGHFQHSRRHSVGIPNQDVCADEHAQRWQCRAGYF